MFCKSNVSKEATEITLDEASAEVLRNIHLELRSFRQERERTGNTGALLPAASPNAISQTSGAKASNVPIKMGPSGAGKGKKVVERPMQMPIKVGVAVVIRRIHDLDTVKQTFAVMLHITMQWAMLPGENPPLPHEDDGDWIPNWTPKLRIRSVIEDSEPDILYFTKEMDNGTQLVISQGHYIAIISEQLELWDFPTDVQNLPIALLSLLPTSTCEWQPIEGTPLVTLCVERCVLNDFNPISECPITYELFAYVNDTKDVSCLSMNIKVVRYSRFYIINVALIMGLVASFILFTWGMHPAGVSERFDVDFSLLLTAVAFKFVVLGMLPTISYLTTLDYYVLSCFGFIIICTLSHAMLPLYHYGKAKQSPLSPRTRGMRQGFEGEDALIAADMQSFWVFLCMWCVFNAAYWTYFSVRRVRIYNKFLKEALAERDKQKKRPSELQRQGTKTARSSILSSSS